MLCFVFVCVLVVGAAVVALLRYWFFSHSF